MSFRFTVKQNPLEMSFEAGSIGEGLAILESDENTLGRFFATASALAITAGTLSTTGETTIAGDTEPTKRTRRTKAQIAADEAAEAARLAGVTAPPPAPIPGQTPAPPAPPPLAAAPPVAPPALPAGATAENTNGIPAFLSREAPTTVAPPPPPPPPQAAPPAPPAPPAVSPLSAKVIEKLKGMAVANGDAGKSLVEWLSTTHIVTKSATFEEAISVLQFCRPEQIAPIAAALSVTA